MSTTRASRCASSSLAPVAAFKEWIAPSAVAKTAMRGLPAMFVTVPVILVTHSTYIVTKIDHIIDKTKHVSTKNDS